MFGKELFILFKGCVFVNVYQCVCACVCRCVCVCVCVFPFGLRVGWGF